MPPVSNLHGIRFLANSQQTAYMIQIYNFIWKTKTLFSIIFLKRGERLA